MEIPMAVRILCVDDEVNQRSLISYTLLKEGYNVKVAKDGKEALNTIKESIELEYNPFELILLDINMPKMDGFTATKLIRESEVSTKKHLLIIGVTADALSSSWEQCREAGMDDIISKPVLLSHINVKLKKWLTPAQTKENSSNL